MRYDHFLTWKFSFLPFHSIRFPIPGARPFLPPPRCSSSHLSRAAPPSGGQCEQHSHLGASALGAQFISPHTIFPSGIQTPPSPPILVGKPFSCPSARSALASLESRRHHDRERAAPPFLRRQCGHEARGCRHPSLCCIFSGPWSSSSLREPGSAQNQHSGFGKTACFVTNSLN